MIDLLLIAIKYSLVSNVVLSWESVLSWEYQRRQSPPRVWEER